MCTSYTVRQPGNRLQWVDKGMIYRMVVICGVEKEAPMQKIQMVYFSMLEVLRITCAARP